MRWLAIAAVAVVSAAIALALEPRCLGGPFAMMDPALHRMWMTHVQEAQPLTAVLRREPQVAAALLVFPALALLAAAVLARDPQMRRNAGFLTATAALVVAVAMLIAMVKSYNYAVWMALPLVAACLPRLLCSLHIRSLGARVVIAMMLAPAVLSAGTVIVVQAATGVLDKNNARIERGCFESKNYAGLAGLPKGLIAADVDFGPFILALTPHAVVGAPYHRLPAGIVASREIFALPDEDARRVVDAHGVTYLVTCGREAPSDLSPAEREHGLWRRLATGDLPDWLEKLSAQGEQVFTVYRVRGARS
jgi:hypothetical protein